MIIHELSCRKFNFAGLSITKGIIKRIHALSDTSSVMVTMQGVHVAGLGNYSGCTWLLALVSFCS